MYFNIIIHIIYLFNGLNNTEESNRLACVTKIQHQLTKIEFMYNFISYFVALCKEW